MKEALMNASEMMVELQLGPGDDHRDEPSSQAAFERAYNNLKSSIQVSPRVLVRKAAGASSSLVGEFLVPLAQAFGPTLGVVLVAWLQGRAGRKVRIKVGDVEAEARTAEEVERLMLRAQEFKEQIENRGEAKS